MPLTDQSELGRDCAAHLPEHVGNPIAEAALQRALAIVPRGALALAGTALGFLLISWVCIYFLVFLPRGAIN
jgi:hypothetical protein